MYTDAVWGLMPRARTLLKLGARDVFYVRGHITTEDLAEVFFVVPRRLSWWAPVPPAPVVARVGRGYAGGYVYAVMLSSATLYEALLTGAVSQCREEPLEILKPYCVARLSHVCTGVPGALGRFLAGRDYVAVARMAYSGPRPPSLLHTPGGPPSVLFYRFLTPVVSRETLSLARRVVGRGAQGRG